MSIKQPKSTIVYQAMFLWGVVFLFLFQLLTEFVEGIYLYGLLGTEIPPEIGLVVLLIAPLLLIFARRNLPETPIKLLASIGLVARCIEITLPTRGRMIISGIGLMGLLLFLPVSLAHERSKEERGEFSHQVGMALGLAVPAHILLRALHSGSDLSAYGGYRLISWILGLAALVVLWRSSNGKMGKSEIAMPASKRNVIIHSLGLFGVLVILDFAIIAPNVVVRWAGVSGISVFALMLASWTAVGWWQLAQKRITKTTLVIAGLLFVLTTTLAIFPHQIDFPAEMDGGYPLLEPDISTIQILPLYLMLALSPVLLMIFIHYLKAILNQQPSIRLLGGSFGLGGAFLLVMVLSQVFTTVYDYIPVIGPFFRDKYWLVFLVPGLVAVLPLLLNSRIEEDIPAVPKKIRQSWIMTAGAMALLAITGMLSGKANPSLSIGEPTSLRVFTYNIQQGYNDLGERNFDGQIALLQSANPDIIGLQESDTARIAGGNTDVVAYFANHLDMHSYYGPSPITGTFGIALLSKFPIQNPRTHFVYSEGEQVAVIEAEITVAGKTYQVFVTHLGNGGPIFQMQQMLEIMRGQQNVIAMGDFNFRVYEEQYEITTAEFDDAFIHARESVAPSTWGENENFDIGERIDHVFVSRGMPVLYAEYFTQNESDHPGLFIELGLGE